MPKPLNRRRKTRRYNKGLIHTINVAQPLTFKGLRQVSYGLADSNNSISSCKSFIHNAYILERFICVFGINPDPQVIDKLFKELILFTARAAYAWLIFNELLYYKLQEKNKYCIVKSFTSFLLYTRWHIPTNEVLYGYLYGQQEYRTA